MKKERDVNLPRLAVILSVMLAAAAAGSMFAQTADGNRLALCAPGLKAAVLFELALVLTLFISGFIRGGSISVLLCDAIKGFALSARATFLIKTCEAGGYAICVPAFLGGALSASGTLLLSLRAVDLSVSKRYNNIGADGSYYSAAALCALLCAAGAVVAAL